MNHRTSRWIAKCSSINLSNYFPVLFRAIWMNFRQYQHFCVYYLYASSDCPSQHKHNHSEGICEVFLQYEFECGPSIYRVFWISCHRTRMQMVYNQCALAYEHSILLPLWKLWNKQYTRRVVQSYEFSFACFYIIDSNILISSENLLQIMVHTIRSKN